MEIILNHPGGKIFYPLTDRATGHEALSIIFMPFREHNLHIMRNRRYKPFQESSGRFIPTFWG